MARIYAVPCLLLPPCHLRTLPSREALGPVSKHLLGCRGYHSVRGQSFLNLPEIFAPANLARRWYILLVIDRWLRYRGYTVKTHYILLQPLAEPLRVASSLLLLSGTFNVIWRRKSHREHRTWVLFNKILFLAVAVASFFYLLLFLAVAACWLDFTSLNTIMDLAGRRNQFELSSAVLFTVYSLFVVLAAGKVYNSGRKVEGRTRITSTVIPPFPRRLVTSMRPR